MEGVGGCGSRLLGEGVAGWGEGRSLKGRSHCTNYFFSGEDLISDQRFVLTPQTLIVFF